MVLFKQFINKSLGDYCKILVSKLELDFKENTIFGKIIIERITLEWQDIQSYSDIKCLPIQ